MKTYWENSNNKNDGEITTDCNESIYKGLEEYDKDIVDDIIKKIKKNYIIKKKPTKFCCNCLHYKKVKPGEITFVGPSFPRIESCNKGHEIYNGVADNCSDYWEVNKNGCR